MALSLDFRHRGAVRLSHFCAIGCLLLLGLALPVVAQQINDCDARDGLEPICGLRGSEDLEVLPGGRQLIVSESQVRFDAKGYTNWLPSGLALLDLSTRRPHEIYPAQAARSTDDNWGDPDCPDEIGARLSPHGIHLSRRDDHHWQLLVVNHGARESVEMFELIGRGKETSVRWRGCVLAPPFAFLNDVAPLPGGGFVVTRYMDARRTIAAQRAEAGRDIDTGYVLRWQPGGKLSEVPGTEAPLPNGIQTTSDGRYMFVSVSGSHGEVRKYELPGGRRIGAAPVPHPDNLSWTSDGRLLAAGLQPVADLTGCFVDFERPCGAAFAIHAVDPVSLQSRQVFAHAGAPLGLATVAVQAGNSLFVGSAAGDRVMRVPAADWRR